jgi:hypothetical protein
MNSEKNILKLRVISVAYLYSFLSLDCSFYSLLEEKFDAFMVQTDENTFTN